MAFAYANDLAVPSVVARLANVYGPGQSTEAVIPSVIHQILQTQSLQLKGGTSSIRDFIFVEDVVEALMFLAISEKASGKAFDVGTGVGTEINKVIEFICEVLNFKASLTAEKGDKSVLVANTNDLKSLGWQAKYSLQEGLTKTIQWEKDNKR
jgi:UDP-glucose 4-epimerase